MNKRTGLTYTHVDGKKYPNQYIDEAGKLRNAPKGKYVDQFGKTRDIPKPKKGK